MKAVGYTRVSTTEQAQQGYGLPAQEQAIRAYCQAQSWELGAIYTDAGKSGKGMQGREELARLLEDAEGFQRVVIWRLDRLARNLRDLLRICDRLEGLDVGVVSVQEAIDTGNPSGRMIRNVLGSLAEFEREVIADRVRAGMAEKARQGRHVGPAPIGYSKDDDGRLVPDPQTAATVRELFNLYATGTCSLRDLALRFDFHDYTRVHHILRNPVYVGRITWGDVTARGEHESLISPALFEHVQEQFEAARHRSPRRPFGRTPYPLTGTAFCSRCGAQLQGSRQRGHRYMRCYTAWRQGKRGCVQPMVRAETLEQQLAGYIGGITLTSEVVQAVAEELRLRGRQPRVDTARTRREMERWKRLFVLGEIEEKRLRTELAPLKRELARVERPVADMEEAVRYLGNVGRLWDESSPDLQRRFVREVFTSLEVKGRELVAIAPRETYVPLFIADRQVRFGGVVEMHQELCPFTSPETCHIIAPQVSQTPA